MTRWGSANRRRSKRSEQGRHGRQSRYGGIQIKWNAWSERNAWSRGGAPRSASGSRPRAGLPRAWLLAFLLGMAAMLTARAALPQHGPGAGSHGASPPAQPAHEAQAQPRGGEAGADPGPGKDGEASASAGQGQARGPLAGVEVTVWLEKAKRAETVPLEDYVRGVVAGEMPADFELEALKAQAIAARTYIVKRLEDGAKLTRGGASVDVGDTEDYQVYVPLARLKEGRTDAALAKLNRAVRETAGEIVTYEGKPIQAAFFSTSNGYTENSEDYWSAKLPYLRSVPSPWDASVSPRYKETVTMEADDFYAKLGAGKGRPPLSVVSYTEGKRIRELRIGSRTISGREARERLGLRSSEFDWRFEGDRVVITTHGSGHGIGMSQWGADALAEAGRTAEAILRYYYTGTKVERASAAAFPAFSQK